jgi:catechol 2,3-dioxygenase-like lactoylglutathione lyase family enzyme
MNPSPRTESNVEQAVPFFMVTNIQESLRYYVDGLGFKMTNQWINGGKLEWCWLQHGGAALMLQEYRKDKAPEGKLGLGVSVCFQCKDALAIYRDLIRRGIPARKPVVGNGMWDTSTSDPDGYKIHFESPTEVPEETEFSEETG